MKDVDLLFISNKTAGHISDTYLTDIGLDAIKDLLDPDEYRVFCDTVRRPITDVELIAERQNILRDFYQYTDLAANLKAICDNAKKNEFPIFNRGYSSFPPERKLVEYVEIINKNLDVPAKLFSVLQHKELLSTELKKLYEKLNMTEKLSDIKAQINTLAQWLLNYNISLHIEYGSTFKFKSASIYSESKKLEKRKTSIFNVKKPILDEVSYGNDYITDLQVGSIILAGLQNLCSMLSSLNIFILKFCRKLSDQLLFYIAALKIINFLDANGIKTIFPEIGSNFREIRASNLYDFGLVFQRKSCKDVIPNDFIDKGRDFYLISGANQGGKTTFLKSIGIAQLFAQAGLKVTASEYRCPVFRNFVSHFPKDEDENLNYGKLAEELSRFKKYVPMMADNALILLNESFATTTEKEGFEIACDVFKALSMASPKILFATHNYHLLRDREKLSEKLECGIKLRSLIVSEGNTPSGRTYKIREGEPQENIHTMDFLKGMRIL